MNVRVRRHIELTPSVPAEVQRAFKAWVIDVAIVMPAAGSTDCLGMMAAWRLQQNGRVGMRPAAAAMPSVHPWLFHARLEGWDCFFVVQDAPDGTLRTVTLLQAQRATLMDWGGALGDAGYRAATARAVELRMLTKN